MTANDPSRRLRLRNVGWFVLLWAASVGALSVVALIFRILMNFAGMTV
jgi:hypothetical protein